VGGNGNSRDLARPSSRYDGDPVAKASDVFQRIFQLMKLDALLPFIDLTALAGFCMAVDGELPRPRG
jgi:hypothetical protein